MRSSNWPQEPRRLDITDLERIACYRRAGYGDSVSDSLNSLHVRDTVLSSQFRALRQGMQLVGRALPVTLHSVVPEVVRRLEDRSDHKPLRMEWYGSEGTNVDPQTQGKCIIAFRTSNVTSSTIRKAPAVPRPG